MSLQDKDYLALTLIGEARGEPIEGIIGVGNVIKNRAYSSQRPYRDVVTSPRQFSCWNNDDPNFVLLQQLTNDLDQGNPIADPFLRQCIWVASGIYIGDLRDNTKGAKNYVTLGRYQVAKARQGPDDKWINSMKPAVTLGQHIFLL